MQTKLYLQAAQGSEEPQTTHWQAAQAQATSLRRRRDAWVEQELNRVNAGVAVPGVAVQGITVQGITVQGITVQGITVQGITVQGITVQGITVQTANSWADCSVVTSGATLTGLTQRMQKGLEPDRWLNWIEQTAQVGFLQEFAQLVNTARPVVPHLGAISSLPEMESAGAEGRMPPADGTKPHHGDQVPGDISQPADASAQAWLQWQTLHDLRQEVTQLKQQVSRQSRAAVFG